MNSKLYMHDVKSIELSELKERLLDARKKESVYFNRTFTITGEDNEFVIELFSNKESLTLKGE